MLKLLRRIFGCYNMPVYEYIDLPDKSDPVRDYAKAAGETLKKCCRGAAERDRKRLIGDMVEAVVSKKRDELTCWVEEAMDAVTDGKFKPIWQRKR